ncbi:outer membrane protein assembly factor BamE [uncultured Planktomarina sp.]|uniref:outer membrane protein assembly factor BamE n=1 Tax=uncultured Planktomarina sp. TaxID=1538529 RepID=UPI003260F6B2
MRNKSKMTVVGVCLITAIACTPVFRNHGYTPSDSQLANLVVGVDTRTTAEETLGPPTISDAKTGRLYYISSRWRHYGLNPPKPISRNIVAVALDSSEVVTNVSRYGLEDGEIVALTRRVTDGGTEEITFLQQLLGNIGRIDASDLLGEP